MVLKHSHIHISNKVTTNVIISSSYHKCVHANVLNVSVSKNFMSEGSPRTFCTNICIQIVQYIQALPAHCVIELNFYEFDIVLAYTNMFYSSVTLTNHRSRCIYTKHTNNLMWAVSTSPVLLLQQTTACILCMWTLTANFKFRQTVSMANCMYRLNTQDWKKKTNFHAWCCSMVVFVNMWLQLLSMSQQYSR